MHIGDIVLALGEIRDRNDGSSDDPIRATADDLGIVEHIDEEGFPTIRFRGGATVVHPDEVAWLGPAD